jgi:7,8-dihydropterin-6-yl-methyl-4-(beta-D-ribofuranosyl)aminobenzene 5'-phosphate synthase
MLRITILYDNTAHRRDCRADWGFSSLIEGAGKTVLFDAGTNPDIFVANAKALRVDLARVEAIVVSHPHQDHTGGLPAALARRPALPVYVPAGSPAALTGTLRSAGGRVVETSGPMEVGTDLVVTGPLGGPVPEQALLIKRSSDAVFVTGCAHPGIVSMVERARKMAGERPLVVLGGFHLLNHSAADIAGIVARLKALGVERVGPTHCTGEKAIDAFRRAYGTRFVEMGAGRVIELP